MRAEAGCTSCCKEEFRPRNFLLTHKYPVLFVRAQWSWPVWVYPVYQTLAAIFFTVFILLSGLVNYDWYIGDTNRVKWFIYLTNHMMFWLTLSVIYRAVTAIQAAASYKSRLLEENVYERHPWYLKLQWVLCNLALGLSVVVTILYWALIYYPGKELYWIDIVVHAANTVYVIMDLFITATPMRLLHVWHSVFYALLYIVFSVIYDVSGGTNALNKPYIYSVLDWSDPNTAAMYGLLTVFVGVPVVWIIVYSLYALRVFIHWKMGGSFWTIEKQETYPMQ